MKELLKISKCAAVSFLFLVFAGSVYMVRAADSVDLPMGTSYNGIEASEGPSQNIPDSGAPASSIKIPIFIYHSVRPHVPESALQDKYDITPELLESQLAYMRDNGYTTISLDDLVRDVEAGTTTPVERPVILTFDDGWENQYVNAFPLLKKYNMTATFYVFTNPISKKEHFLTWDQLREMDQAGMTIASHTLTHPYLNEISSDELKREITESKKIIEAEIGKPVRHFASPFGYTDAEVVQDIALAGYATGRTTYAGEYHSKNDLLETRGYLVDDSLDDFIKVLKQ